MKLSRFSKTVLLLASMLFGSLYLGVSAGLSKAPESTMLLSIGMYCVGGIVVGVLMSLD